MNDEVLIGDVMDYWFGAAPDDADALAEKNGLWFAKNAQVDADIRARFGELREAALAGALDDWLAAPRGRLALIVLVDQFSRNLFRDDPRAFAHDALARAWTLEGLRSGADRSLRRVQRVFFYLPLEHSESLADQQRSVALFAQLREEVPAGEREHYASYLRYAERHRDVIARFGRFPHRNGVLGRVSTTEEAMFLAQPGSSF